MLKSQRDCHNYFKGGDLIGMTYNEIKKLVEDKLITKTDERPYEELSEMIFGEGNCFNESEVRKRIRSNRKLVKG